jgi:hypothetical protein
MFEKNILIRFNSFNFVSLQMLVVVLREMGQPLNSAPRLNATLTQLSCTSEVGILDESRILLLFE